MAICRFQRPPGGVNAHYTDLAQSVLRESCQVKTVLVAEPWDIEAEVCNQLWADVIILQFPLNSMGPPWRLKQYLDEVYTAGMDGRLANGDGRSRYDTSRQYGSGGLMQSTRYMLSLTMNAPKFAFDDEAMDLFVGKSVDDLLLPLHINFAFFGMKPLATFVAHDVNKNPSHESDFRRFETHLRSQVISIKR